MYIIYIQICHFILLSHLYFSKYLFKKVWGTQWISTYQKEQTKYTVQRSFRGGQERNFMHPLCGQLKQKYYCLLIKHLPHSWRDIHVLLIWDKVLNKSLHYRVLRHVLFALFVVCITLAWIILDGDGPGGKRRWRHLPEIENNRENRNC